MYITVGLYQANSGMEKQRGLKYLFHLRTNMAGPHGRWVED